MALMIQSSCYAVLSANAKAAFHSLQDEVLKDPALSELRRLGPLTGMKFFGPLMHKYIELYALDTLSYEDRDFISACVTGEFWDNIPAE
jgi:hypothetical protein